MSIEFGKLRIIFNNKYLDAEKFRKIYRKEF